MSAFGRHLPRGLLAGCVLSAVLGCAQSVTAPGPTATGSDSGLLGTEANFIRRSGGTVVGRIHVAAVQMDPETTSQALRELGRWTRLIKPHADIEVVVDRSVSPSSLTTSAPLLVIPAEPTRKYTRGDFWQRLMQYMAAGGTVLFTQGEIPADLRPQGVRPIGRSNSVMTTPFQVNPSSSSRSECVEVGGQAAALDIESLSALSPLLRINVIAHAIKRHPAGAYELEEARPAEGPAEAPPARRDTPFD